MKNFYLQFFLKIKYQLMIEILLVTMYQKKQLELQVRAQ